MAILSAAQKSAIAAGAPVRQVWKAYVPQGAGSTTFNANTIHDDVSGPLCMVDAGSRTGEAYNVSMKEPGRLSSGLYRFEVANSDGKFYDGGDAWENSSTSYDASPRECEVEHQIYVLVAGSWSEITGLKYRGHIVEIEYDDDKATVSIGTVCIAVHNALAYVYSAEDAEIQDTGLDDVYFEERS